jgi:glycerate 2-kinase
VRILQAALDGADPASAVRRSVQREADSLRVGDRTYDLTSFSHIFILGIGKAGLAMAEALTEIIDERLTSGLVIVKHAQRTTPGPLCVIEGGHPIPDERSLEAGRKVLAFLNRIDVGDLLFCLISGGGSALMTAPLETVSLGDLQALASAMLACGAEITEINTLRRRLDLIKGGGVAKRISPARCISLILSDVVGNPLEAIASGPTAPDPTTRRDAMAVLRKYHLRNQVPSTIWRTLEHGVETPKAGDTIFAHVQNVIVGSNLLAAQASLKQAGQDGFHPYLLRIDLQGEASRVAPDLCRSLRWAWKMGDPVPRPACIVAGGELTVTLHGKGRGGRNQELALAAVTELADFPDVMLISLATDGEDGPTDAAGAVVTGQSYQRALALGMQPVEYLRRNDSYTFFEALDDLLKPGPTGTNVNDLVYLFTF